MKRTTVGPPDEDPGLLTERDSRLTIGYRGGNEWVGVPARRLSHGVCVRE